METTRSVKMETTQGTYIYILWELIVPKDASIPITELPTIKKIYLNEHDANMDREWLRNRYKEETAMNCIYWIQREELQKTQYYTKLEKE